MIKVMCQVKSVLQYANRFHGTNQTQHTCNVPLSGWLNSKEELFVGSFHRKANYYRATVTFVFMYLAAHQ